MPVLGHVFGALKHHVFEEVSESGLALAFVPGPHAIPDVDSDDRRRGIVGKIYAEAVIQS
jgi:hypothetical protein